MITPQTLKGFRDFLPQEASKRQYVITKLKTVFATFGFAPLETPTLEYQEILTGKYGDEGEKLMYRFVDNGGRDVAMRYDQTVPLARVVTQYLHQTDNNDHALTLPFKRYQIQNVWRADKPQKGRYREFLQCDADIVGMPAGIADSEIIAVVSKAVEALGFRDYTILINDRSIFGDLPTEAIITIDKLKKIGELQVVRELEEQGLSKNDFEKIKNASLPLQLQKIMDQAIQQGVDASHLVFEPTLARGLDYYTGLIFEVEIPSYPVGSVCGGGRYDRLLGMFSKQAIPAVGFAFGFDRIIEAMTTVCLFPANVTTTTQVLVTIFQKEFEAASLEIASKLRAKGIKTEVYLDANAKIEKQLKYANQKQIPFVAIIGPEEQKTNKIMLRDMQTRDQQVLSLDKLIDTLAT